MMTTLQNCIHSVQINSKQTSSSWKREEKKINNIKHLHLGLTKISLKVCNWQSFVRNYCGILVQGKNIIITFGCAFAQEKYLITEFMHVSSSATNIIVWLWADAVVCVWEYLVRLEKYRSFQQFGKIHSPWVVVCNFSMSRSTKRKLYFPFAITWCFLVFPFTFASLTKLGVAMLELFVSVAANLIKIKQSKMKCWK